MSSASVKNRLYAELRLKNEICVEGVNADLSIFRHLGLGQVHQEQVHDCFEMDRQTHIGVDLPSGYETPGGLMIAFNWNPASDFEMVYSGGRFLITKNGHELFPVVFDKRPRYYGRAASDGTPLKNIGSYEQGGVIDVTYSNECALKEKGLDCLFCNINATKDTYAQREGISWKNPRQIGEAVKAAFELDHVKHMNLTGGFIPERREVDYYVDVAEAVQDITGLEDFNGTAVIGAPLDFSVIDKLRDAGFRTIAMNLEVWDKDYYEYVLPGKVSSCGGRENWIRALEHAAGVFGKGRVRSGFVAGIEPMEATLEGVRYLASIGVLSLTGAWIPNPGSKLEGHRTPEPEWHLEMAYQCFSIFKQNGYRYSDYFDIAPSANFLIHDLFAIDEELLPAFHSDAAEERQKGGRG